MVETAATLVERTEAIAEHLARYLRESGDPMAKTIVFCVDQDHAERMRAALARDCADRLARYPDYLERIVSDEGIDGKRALGRFSTPDEPTPVIVTTSRLLSTGVDVPTCKNIVLARPIGSIVEFKQIIGRGTRLHEPTKTWFTILDYAGSTRHFFDPEFDGDPEGIEIEVLAPRPEPAGARSHGASAGGAGPLSPDGQVPAGVYGTDTQATSGSMVKEPEPAGGTFGAGAESPSQPAPAGEVPGAGPEVPPLTPSAAPTGAALPPTTGTQPTIPLAGVTPPRTDSSTPPGPHPSETDEI
jgi:hypothetical protein